jgi:glycosyltransferase involved in cell wall biosynthesis
MIPRYAIIPTANRPQVARQCIDAIAPQVDVVYVVDNGDNEPLLNHLDDDDYPSVYVIQYDKQGQVPNLCLFWNIALDLIKMDAKRMEVQRWDVAILNDDAIVPEGWFDAVSSAMRENNCAAASSCGGAMAIHREPGPVPIMTRMYGPAFIVAGEKGLRGDERLKWYYTDDYMDWESRKLGGMVIIPGYTVNHLHPNAQVTGEIQVQISNDATLFKEIYGVMPW